MYRGGGVQWVGGRGVVRVQGWMGRGWWGSRGGCVGCGWVGCGRVWRSRGVWHVWSRDKWWGEGGPYRNI